MQRDDRKILPLSDQELAGKELILGCMPCLDSMKLGYVPYKGSIVGHCSKCDQRVWIGPEQQRMHEEKSCPIICLNCLIKEHGAETLGMMRSLTDKGPEE